MFLIGLMGSGKTTLGRQLASLTGLPWFDLDAEIERTEGRIIRDIFREDGIPHFRELERDRLSFLLKNERLILSCGGGTPCFHGGMDRMLESGTVVFLTLPVEQLADRLVADSANRPLIAGMDREGILRILQHLERERMEVFRRAHHTVPGTISADALAALLNPPPA